MDEYLIGVLICAIAVILFVSGGYAEDSVINEHCEKYGQHVNDKWKMTCTKNKGE